MWPFGSKDFSKNEEAAKADFLHILSVLGIENKGAELSKFSNGFKRIYERYKKQLKTKESSVKPRDDKKTFSSGVESYLDQAVGYIEEYQREKDSEKLGSGLGVFLAVMQFGLGSAYFDHYDFDESTVEKVKSMMATLHRVNPSVKCVQMSGRVLKI